MQLSGNSLWSGGSRLTDAWKWWRVCIRSCMNKFTWGEQNINDIPHISSVTLAVRACRDGAMHSVTQQKHAFLTAIEKKTDNLFLTDYAFCTKNKTRKDKKQTSILKSEKLWSLDRNSQQGCLCTNLVSSVLWSAPKIVFLITAVPINQPGQTGAASQSKDL